MITLDEQIACVERELQMRRQVFPRRVADRRMSQAKMDHELAVMGAVRDTLKRLKAREGQPDLLLGEIA